MKSALAALGVLAALVASGAATVEQATDAGMLGAVPIALVVLLEVVNVAGTWTWMTDPRTHVQVEAAAGVAAASTVTGACGLLSYGPLGLVPAAGVLFTVHLVGRLTHRAVPQVDQPAVVEAAPAAVLFDPAGVAVGDPETFRWPPLDRPAVEDVAPPAEDVDPPNEEEDPETEEVPLPPHPDEFREDEQDDEDEPDGENELDDRGHPVDHRLIPWHALTKEQAQAEARRLTDRGHRVTQSRKTLDELRRDVRDARRALNEEPAA